MNKRSKAAESARLPIWYRDEKGFARKLDDSTLPATGCPGRFATIRGVRQYVLSSVGNGWKVVEK